MNLRYNRLLVDCMNSKYWINQGGINNSLLHVDTSNHEANELQTLLQESLITENEKDLFLTFIDAKLDNSKKLFSLNNSVGLFLGAAYIGVCADSYISLSFKIALIITTLVIILFATYLMNSHSNNKHIKLSLIKKIVGRLSY